jgi:hypothetical protein
VGTLVDLSQWLDALPGQLEPTTDEMFALGDGQRERIKERTSQGIGVELDIFAPYAKSTKKEPPVNLTETGDMMSSIVVDSDDNSTRVYFGNDDAEEKAVWQNEGTKTIPQRFFFGVSENDRNELVKELRTSMTARLQVKP